MRQVTVGEGKRGTNAGRRLAKDACYEKSGYGKPTIYSYNPSYRNNGMRGPYHYWCVHITMRVKLGARRQLSHTTIEATRLLPLVEQAHPHSTSSVDTGNVRLIINWNIMAIDGWSCRNSYTTLIFTGTGNLNVSGSAGHMLQNDSFSQRKNSASCRSLYSGVSG